MMKYPRSIGGTDMGVLKLCGISLALALGVAAATPASASQSYAWSFVNLAGDVTGSGTLVADTPDLGGYDVIAIHGSFNDATAGLVGAITGFTPGAGVDAFFAWDNIVYTTTPHVDDLGLLFQVGSTRVNLYNSVGPFAVYVYPGLYPKGDDVTGSGATSRGTFNLTAVPEPANWALMILGFASAGAMLRRRRRAHA
jgi:hypothetical protein